MRIGELATNARVSVGTPCLSERRGLLPKPKRSASRAIHESNEQGVIRVRWRRGRRRCYLCGALLRWGSDHRERTGSNRTQFLRSDAILLPVIAIAIGVALIGFWRGRAIHHSATPFMLGLLGSIGLALGVVLLHGLVAKLFIGAGAVALLIATIWNARLIGRCDLPVSLTRRVEP